MFAVNDVNISCRIYHPIMSSNTPPSATCGLCSKLYVDPRMLQCLHSFCSKCLKTVLDQQGSRTSFKCPSCKKPTTISRGGIAALPKDLRKSYEAEVAQIASKMQSEEKMSCDQCVDPSSGPAVSFCVNCSDFLCNACAKHHKTWRKTLNHDVQPIGGSKSGSNVAAKPLDSLLHKPMNCQLHEDETLKFYCETCGTLICRDCMAIEHAGHTYDRIEKLAEKEKAQLVSLLGNADSAKAKLDGAIAKGGKIVLQVQAKQKCVEKDIKSAFKALNKTLLNREQALIAKAAEISLGKQTALTMQGEELKTLHKEIFETCEIVSTATKVYSPAKMLSAKGTMTYRLEQLLKKFQVVDLEPCRSDMISSILGTSEVAKYISSFGMVAGGSSPGEAKVDLYIPRAIKGKQKKIVVTTFDASGKPFSCGGERVEATLSLLGSEYRPITAKVVDNKDGTYIASFTPQRNGEHQLSITIDSMHIKGSPFPIYIRQERNYRSLSTSQQCFALSESPYDVAVEDNQVYVALYNYHCIEIFNQNGQCVRTIGMLGSPGNADGQFNSPSAIAIRGDVLYVVESGNCRVQKFTTSGKFMSKFGMRGSGNVDLRFSIEAGITNLFGDDRLDVIRDGHFINPRGICLDNDGHVYISNCGNMCISVFEADGTFLYHITGSAADGSNLQAPWGLAFDHCRNLHVADTNTSMIKVFTPQGQYVTQYNSGVNQPAGIAIDDEGNIFIADYYYSSNYHSRLILGQQNYGRMGQSNPVCILDSKHNIIHSFGVNQNEPRGYASYGANQNLTGITIDKEGSIYVCDFNACQIRKF